MVKTCISLKKQQKNILDEISRLTGIPLSVLIRKGANLIIRQYADQGIVFNLDKYIDETFKEHDQSLKELADE